MWYEHIGFKVDRKFKSAMQDDDLEAIKKLLKPSKDPEEVSLNSLLPEVIKLGRVNRDQLRITHEFHNLDAQEKEGCEKVFNNYLSESIDIIIDLIDYLVHKGADVNAELDPAEHKISCFKGIIHFGILDEEFYKLSASLYMPLTIGKFNVGFIQHRMHKLSYYVRGDIERNAQQRDEKKLISYISQQNYNMQIRLTQELINHGANFDATCINEKGHETNFLDFINDCADSRFSDQKKCF